MLFASISMAVIHVLHPSGNIANLYCYYSNELKFLIMVSYTILQPRLRIACTYLRADNGPCNSFYCGSIAEEVT